MKDIEKQGPVVSGSHSPPTSDHVSKAATRHGGKPRDSHLKELLHPNGKKIHIASSPSEAAQLQHTLSNTSNPSEFEVHLSGTPEHLAALRHAHTYHSWRREELRGRHRELYEEFENVHGELDRLANELQRVTTSGVALDAQFTRFGYSATVRTYEGEEAGSRATSLSGSEGETSSSEKGHATKLKLFKKPTLRQYFHKGIIWRASDAEEVQSFELFVDLLYVGIIQINGDLTSEDPTALSFLHFVITFTLGYKIWNDMNLFISWFETDDVFQRVSILFLLACLFGYTTNITQAFDSTYATLIGFYLAARFFMAAYLLLVGYLIPMIRPIMIYHAIVTLVGAALWIGSVHVEWPGQLGLIFAALFVDIGGQVGYLFGMTIFYRLGENWKAWWDKKFEYYPAINIEHRTERTNAFVTLVFGYTVVAILYQSTVNGIDAFFGKGILGLVQCFIFNWIYFEIDGANLHSHAIRRHRFSAMLWSLVHLPFIMSFVLGGAGLARLVLANDTADSHRDWLTTSYQERSEEEIPNGIRWFYSAGFGVALFCMGVISLTHEHKEQEGTRLTKKFRLMTRFVVVVILVLLPLAHGLNSLELIGIVTALLVLSLMTELWAASDVNETVFGRSRTCRYTGQCQKKDLQAILKAGDDDKVEGLVADRNENSGATIS